MKIFRIPFLLFAILLVGACAMIEQRMARPHPRTEFTLIERLRLPAVGGHQGDIYGLKFNTITAFNIADSAGVDIVEMDLHQTKDGIPVVYHDHELSRFTNCKGLVSEHTFLELQDCKFIFSNEKIPKFEDVLIWSRGNVVINAEFKEIGPIQSSLSLVAKYNAYEWVYFQVLSDEQYDLVRSIDPNVNILLKANDHIELERIMARNDPHILLIEVKGDTLSPIDIDRIHTNGKLVSIDAWNLSMFWEFFGATCAKVWERNIDVAISNRPFGCVEEKKRFLRERAERESSEYSHNE